MTSAPVNIRKHADTASYYRPEWMSDAQWRAVSVEMTEHWLTLVSAVALRTAYARRTS